MAEDVERAKRRKVLTWLAIGVSVALAGWFLYRRYMDPIDAQQAYDAGARLLQATRYQQAILNFDRATALNPDFTEAYRLRGRSYVADNNADGAIRDFTRVTQLAPRDAAALVERGFARIDKKDWAKAVADADRAIELNPKLARAFNLRGTARRAAGDAGRAVDDFSRAIELEPSLDHYFQRAATLQILERHREAIADLNEAIAYSPDQPHIFFARAESKAAVGDTQGAKSDIQAGRKIDGW